MSLVLIISILLLAIVAVLSFYRFQSRRLFLKAARTELAPPRPVKLFADQTMSESAVRSAATEQTTKPLNEMRRTLLDRAAEGDKETLLEAARFDADKALYGEVLNKLVARVADDAGQLKALAEFIAQHEDLRATPQLAGRLIDRWQSSPAKFSIALVLHTAALSDDAAIYEQAIETLLQMWREERLPRIDAEDLRTLVESEYWMLAPHARSSGAGFVLKQTLARFRREARHIAPPVSAK